MVMTPEVQQAIAELQETWQECPITTREDDEGGAFVIMEQIALFPPYTQATTWAGFRLVFQYPYADVYPHFIRGDLSRTDGRALGEAMTQTAFEGRAAIQISRRTTNYHADLQTAAIKLHKVLEWLRTRP